MQATISPSLASLASLILPIATHYTAITAFITQQSHLSAGLTTHALCAALRTDVIENSYLVLLTQLEHQFNTVPTFSLKRFWFFVQDMARTLELVHQLTTGLLASPSPDEDDSDGDHTIHDSSSSDAESDVGGPGAEGLKAVLSQMRGEADLDAAAKASPAATWAAGGPVKGGEVLAVIHERLLLLSGDPIAADLYSSLLLKASQPYAHMLVKWISTGALWDPHDEFMIRESRTITRGSLEIDYVDEYWERRYTLKTGALAAESKSLPLADADSRSTSTKPTAASDRRSARERGIGGGAIVPTFLESWKVKILLAGKYLNVIRECGIGVQMPDDITSTSKSAHIDIAVDSEAFVIRPNSSFTD